MNLDVTTLIASGAIVIFLVQQAKRWVPNDFLPIIALVIGVLVQVVNDVALGGGSDSASIWTSIVVGAGVGMAAAGTYDLAGRASSTIPPAEIVLADEPELDGEFDDPYFVSESTLREIDRQREN
jgi:hypothetical protein